MIRYASRFRILPTKKINSLREPQCFQSTSSPQQKGASSNMILIGAGTAVSVAGLVAYASWSPANQKGVQSAIPGSKYILEPLLGAVAEPPLKPVQTPKPQAPDDGLLKKKLDREKAKKEKEKVDKKDDSPTKSSEAEPPKQVLPPPPPPPPTAAVPPELPTPPTVSEDPQKEEKPVVQTQDTEASPNATLSQALQENMSLAQKNVQSAMKMAELASEAVRKHAEKAYSLIDSDDGEKQLFAITTDLSRIKNELLREVEEKLNSAKDAISVLQKNCSSGLESEATKTNPQLATAKEKISEFSYSMNKINSIVAEALREASALNDFKDLVLESRKQFEAELNAMSPGLKLGEKNEKLGIEELNSHLMHAHRKVIALQKHLAKHQTLDKGRFKDSVLRQRDQESRYIEGRLQAELERQRHELGMEYRRRLQQLKEDNENEMRLQLKRQAAAHSDHLAEVVYHQEQELEHKWQGKLEETLQLEKDEYLRTLSKINGQLNGLKTAMKRRADIDKAAHEAHELWMACQAFKSALRMGKEDAKSWEEQLLPLQERIDAVAAAAGEGNPFAEAVLSSIPEIARSRGIYTEDALRERFIKVQRVCKRVSMIGDNGGSLLRYLLSYMQSFLIINAFEYIPGKEVRDEEIALDKLNTYDLLARAKYCLEKDDLLQAIRYMNLLRGEPRHVAKDWIDEARLALEARLAADALMAHAAATGARAL